MAQATLQKERSKSKLKAIRKQEGPIPTGKQD